MNKALQSFTALVPVSSIEGYVHQVNQIPMLTLEQEQTYSRNLFYNNDLTAAQQLILPHLRYVVKVAKSYAGYGLSLADLIQEGNVGLMKAVKKFNPEVGVRLVSFAVHWIKAEIHEFILRNWRIVKVATTKAQRKLFFNLRKMKKRLGWFSHQEVQDVAKDLGVEPKTVVEMEQRLNAMDAAFDGSASDDDERAFAPAQYLEDNSMNPEQLCEQTATAEFQREALTKALATLDERSQMILQYRWLVDEKKTLHELAAELNVSAERVRQIEKAAFKKIKLAIAA